MNYIGMFNFMQCFFRVLAVASLLWLSTASFHVTKVSAAVTPWSEIHDVYPKEELAVEKDETLVQKRRVLAMDGEGKINNTNSTEAEALLRFREAVVDDPDGILESWNATSTSSVCSWVGVTCDTSNHVSTLNLSDQRLAGNISPLLGSLGFLSSLVLAGNSFSGSIPSSLGTLRRLHHLDFSRNNLTLRIPPEISNCSSLTYLNFSSNNLSGSIPVQLGNLQNLSVMGFSNNELSASIPRELGNCSSLEYLDLSFNQITGTVPYELGRLRGLSNLVLSNNLLSGSIPKSLSNCTSLTNLNLAVNNLTGNILSELGELRELQYLELYSTGLGGSIPTSLGNLSSLVRLELGCLPLVISYVTTCPLTGEIPPQLGQLKHLSFFGLTITNVTGPIPKELGNLPNITRMFLYKNQLTGRIPPVLGNLSTLLTLMLDSNQLEGEIPSSLGNLVNVGWLALRDNRLTGNIPAAFGNYTRMYRLLLSHNRLNGPVISELGRLASMQELGLDYNQFSGELPTALANLSQLTQLFLSYNNISGSLPVAMARSLTALYNFSFTNNQLSGSIPGEIGNMASLEYLNLSSNNLSGAIPSSIEECQGLTSIDVSNNRLSGELPIAALESLLYLQSFTVANNDLEGAIPERVGPFVNVTADSYAGNAGLCGPLLGKNCSSNSGCHGIGGACHRVWIYVGSGAAAILLAVFTIMMLLLNRRKLSRKRANIDANIHEGPLKTENFEDDLKINEHANELNLTIDDLWAATGGFSELNVLGEGGQGTVYKAILPHGDGTIFAVKRMRVDPKERGISSLPQDLYNELRVLRNVRHRNLVKLHGCCTTERVTALLMEYVPNGSLQSHLHPNQSNPRGNYGEVQTCQLSLKVRMRIATGVADAMAYLHHECHEPVIHCDLKPSNVLLDYEFNVKVTDFGISRYVRKDKVNQETTVSALYGTMGYIPPEYATSNRVSTKGDVYSYGVVLLELMTGKRPTDETFAQDGTWLRDWVLKSFPHRIAHILDDRIKSDFDINEGQIRMLILVGLLCTREATSERPSMQDIQGILAEFSEPSSKTSPDLFSTKFPKPR